MWPPPNHKSPPSSDDQDIPQFPGSRCHLPPRCRTAGTAPLSNTLPRALSREGPRWWHGGGHREGMPPPAGSGVGSLCNVNCSRRQRG